MNLTRAITILLAIGLALGFASQPLRAANFYDSGGVTYMDDGGPYIHVYRCYTTTSGALTIPATFVGKPVFFIDANAFQNCTLLSSVTLPANLPVIAAGTFSGCTGLTSFTIPSSVVSIAN